MADEDDHGDGAEQRTPPANDNGQRNGGHNHDARQRAGRERRHVRAVGEEHAGPDDHDGDASRTCEGAARQPRRQAQQPRQGGLHQPRQLTEQRRGDFGGRTDHRGRRRHNRQGQRGQTQGQEFQRAGRRAGQATQQVSRFARGSPPSLPAVPNWNDFLPQNRQDLQD